MRCTAVISSLALPWCLQNISYYCQQMDEDRCFHQSRFFHSSEYLAIILLYFLVIEIQLSFLVIQVNTLWFCCLYYYPFCLCGTFATYSFSFNCTSIITSKHHFSQTGIIFQLHLLNPGFCMCEYNKNNFLCHLPSNLLCTSSILSTT